MKFPDFSPEPDKLSNHTKEIFQLPVCRGSSHLLTDFLGALCGIAVNEVEGMLIEEKTIQEMEVSLPLKFFGLFIQFRPIYNKKSVFR